MSTETIELKDIGPIENLSIALPEGGGVVVLRGGQGVGKSTALKAVSKLAGGNVKDLSARDGTKRGVLELGDARLTVTKARASRTGELEVAELESRLDIAALVDPNIDDPDRADAKRIKALVALAGVKADAAAYHNLVGGREAFDKLGVDADTEDPLELAGRVKRALEGAARRSESLADAEAIHAKACKDATEGIDMGVACDATELQSAYNVAHKRQIELIEQRRQADADFDRKKEASDKLSEAEAGYSGASAKECQVAVVKAQGVADDALRVVQELKSKLQLAESELSAAHAMKREADKAHEVACGHDATIAAWRETLDAPGIDDPGDEAITQAKAVTDIARQSIEQGVRVRDAKQAVSRGANHEGAAKLARKEADRMRDAGRAVDDVLSGLVPASALRVEAGRLVTSTDRSQSELYADLSEGERWDLAIDLAAVVLPDHSLLVLPQEAYAALQPANKRRVHERAKSHGIWILTAEVTDGALAVGANE